MRSNIAKRAAAIGWPILVTALILLAWEISVRALGIRSIILPPPSAVFAAMAERHDLLLTHLWPSLYLTVLGFGLSVVGGIFVAVLITYSEIVRKGFYPVIVVSQVIPKISIAPLFIVWFGTGTLSSLLLAFLVAFFPMTINAAMGFESIDEDIHRMARTFMGSRWQIFTKIQLPNALPYIFSGMKVAAILAVAGAIVGEFLGSDKGLGYLMLQVQVTLDTAAMFMAVVLITLIGMVLYAAVLLLERALVVPDARVS